MASSLTGLMRQLTWADFAMRQGSEPPAGTPATAAFTDPGSTVSPIAFSPVKDGPRGSIELKDNLQVSVFMKPTSFKMSWLADRSTGFQTDLLNHEQGHYTILALLARDYFVDMMLLKGKIFATDKEATDAVEAIRKGSLAKNKAIQALYDHDVHPEQAQGLSRGPKQQEWDKIFRAAFTNPRASGTTTPDGTPHKARLVVVIRASGRTI